MPNHWFTPGRPPVPITCMPVMQPGGIIAR
jgi:hypothetical protein